MKHEAFSRSNNVTIDMLKTDSVISGQTNHFYMVPLHQKGCLNDVNDYRGITLLSCVGKLFTSILNNRLYDWGETYNVFMEAQA